MSKGFSVSELGQNLGTYTGSKIATGISNKLGDVQQKATGAIDNLNNQLTQEMQALITNGIDKVYNSLGLTDDNIAFAKNILSIANNAIPKLDMIFSLIPNNVTVTPVVKETMSPLTSSVLQILKAQYAEALSTYKQLNESLVTVIGQPLEVVNACIILIVDKVEALIDEQIYKYTGYHLNEIPPLCIKAIQLINQLKKIKNEKQKEVNDKKTELTDKAENTKNDISDKTNKAVNSGNDLVSSGQSTKVSVSVDTEQLKANSANEVKQALFKYLDGIATPLYNAFMMLQIKDMVIQIKDMCQMMTNISISNLKKTISDVELITGLITELIGPDPTFISLDDIKNMGLNAMLKVTSQFNEAFDNAKNYKSLTDNFNTGQLVGAASSTININVKSEKTYEIKEDKVDANGNTYFNLTLYKSPKTLFKVLNNNFKKIKASQNNQILTNKDISNFINDLITLWDANKNQMLAIDAKIDNVNRKYIFNVIIDKSKEKKKDENTQQMPDDKKDDLSFDDKMQLSLDALTSDNTEIVQTNANKNGKLLFDIIGILLKMIKPLGELFKKLSELIENYKINKEKVLHNSTGNISKLMDKIMEESGFKKLNEDTNNSENAPSDNNSNNQTSHNFYTVRTKKLNDWLSKNDIVPNRSGLCTINEKQTNNLIDNCISFSKNLETLNRDTITDLYFDADSINEEQRIYDNILSGKFTKRNGKEYLDGTTNDLDNLNIDNNTGNIYVTENNKSTISSEILRAINRQYNPRI